MKTLVVVGAGPIGLEAAIGATDRGFAVTVLEKGRVGENFRRYGSTRLFSPFAMNVSARARALLGAAAPSPDALLVGHGHSAAGALAAMAALPDPPRIHWATRSANRRPCVEIAGDPLPERARVTANANRLASDPPPFLTVERRTGVEAFAPRGGRVAVTLTGSGERLCDAVLGFTGYRPDLSFLSELALDVSPATEGALGVARVLAGVTDCLAVPRVTPADLDSGEPGFHLVGAKSYGRLPTFLLRNGIEQLTTILDGLAAPA